MNHEGNTACAGCTTVSRERPESRDGSSRRDFVRDAMAAAGMLLLGLGVDPARAWGLPIRSGTGERDPNEGADTLSFALPTTDGVTVDRKNEIILVRWQGSVFAFALSCPHQRTMLRWLEREQRFQCPKHKSKYRPDGAFISGRATRGMDRYPIRMQNGKVIVDGTRTIHEDENAASWSDAVISLG